MIIKAYDLLRYKLEQKYKKFGNMIKSKKMRKAKELEELEAKYDDECIDMYFKCVENNLTPNKDWLDHKIKYLLINN